MRTSFNAVVLENASHKATISTMGSEMNDMKHRLQIAERKVTQLRTPPPPQKRSSPVMGSPHLHHASSPPFSPLIDVPVGVAPAIPKLALQYTLSRRWLPNMKAKTKARDLQCYWLTWRATSVSIPIKYQLRIYKHLGIFTFITPYTYYTQNIIDT